MEATGEENYSKKKNEAIKMKCKDLKKILSNIDDEEEIAFHIFNHPTDADEFLSLVNDAVNNRTIISVADSKYVIK
jgi:Mg/Co/Ni transporter MgtE